MRLFFIARSKSIANDRINGRECHVDGRAVGVDREGRCALPVTEALEVWPALLAKAVLSLLPRTHRKAPRPNPGGEMGGVEGGEADVTLHRGVPHMVTPFRCHRFLVFCLRLLLPARLCGQDADSWLLSLLARPSCVFLGARGPNPRHARPLGRVRRPAPYPSCWMDPVELLLPLTEGWVPQRLCPRRDAAVLLRLLRSVCRSGGVCLLLGGPGMLIIKQWGTAAPRGDVPKTDDWPKPNYGRSRKGNLIITTRMCVQVFILAIRHSPAPRAARIRTHPPRGPTLRHRPRTPSLPLRPRAASSSSPTAAPPPVTVAARRCGHRRSAYPSSLWAPSWKARPPPAGSRWR